MEIIYDEYVLRRKISPRSYLQKIQELYVCILIPRADVLEIFVFDKPYFFENFEHDASLPNSGRALDQQVFSRLLNVSPDLPKMTRLYIRILWKTYRLKHVSECAFFRHEPHITPPKK